MITPNKVVTIEESAIGRAPALLERGTQPISVSKLYEETARSFEGIDQFLLALDALFVLGKIDIDAVSGIVTYAR